MPQRGTLVLRIRGFSHPSWIFPTMILKLSQSANKLKYLMKNVIKLLIVRPKIEKPLIWDRKLFFDIRSQQFPDVNFTIFTFFKNNFVTWQAFKEICCEAWPSCSDKKPRKKNISPRKCPFPSHNLGKVIFLSNWLVQSGHFYSRTNRFLIWTNVEMKVFEPKCLTKFGSCRNLN